MPAQAVSKGILSIGSWSVVKMATSALVLPILARMRELLDDARTLDELAREAAEGDPA